MWRELLYWPGELLPSPGHGLLFKFFFRVIVEFLSAFMNNVGALALMMPVAIEIASRENRSPSYLLMPMAFASLLGGMTTLIGTPPNLLISNYRRTHHGEPFVMFDFLPVGLPIAIAGIAFIVLLGWCLIPKRKPGSDGDLFDIENYLTTYLPIRVTPSQSNRNPHFIDCV